MDPALTATLTTLLPSLSTIPPDLIRHATHLLLASKHAIQLPARQEHARAYICAHIACVRLAPVLSLPQPTNVHVPVSKRQYDALYKLFDQKLPAITRHSEDKDRSGVLRDVVERVCDAMHVTDVALVKNGMACLWGADGEKGSTVFAIRKGTGEDRRVAFEWSVLGAMIFTLRFGDVIDHSYVSPEQPEQQDHNPEEIEDKNDNAQPTLEMASTASMPSKPKPPKARISATKEQSLFKAKFLKLSFGRIKPADLDNAILDLQTACFTTSRSSKRPYTKSTQTWILNMRKGLNTQTSGSSQMDGGSRTKGLSGIGRMVRTSVIFLTEERRREYEVWMNATKRRLDVLESQSKRRLQVGA
ncbi:hypothetical protein V1525DRAFT_413329 [Lipomyces kononenkoae]|uniref:Uncharacterized protein n=1 Tax=Lipomyces kononenkoae TaxID=34357 RepID=A0ACC3SRV9_LIPKO